MCFVNICTLTSKMGISFGDLKSNRFLFIENKYVAAVFTYMETVTIIWKIVKCNMECHIIDISRKVNKFD